jgi:hypothetical protein
MPNARIDKSVAGIVDDGVKFAGLGEPGYLPPLVISCPDGLLDILARFCPILWTDGTVTTGKAAQSRV